MSEYDLAYSLPLQSYSPNLSPPIQGVKESAQPYASLFLSSIA